MQNNIFFKNKKDKFNPDISTNLAKKNIERKKCDFIPSKNVYNPITDSIPTIIKNSKDLEFIPSLDEARFIEFLGNLYPYQKQGALWLQSL